jgi:hypothetical protein
MMDVFAISTYFSVSLLFWYTGLLPDIASIRDRAVPAFAAASTQSLSFGWSGFSKNMAAFRNRIAYFGRYINTTGTFGTHHCII